MAPKQFEPEYVNRKGQHSLNVQIVGTGELLIADIVADWAGGSHDSRVLKNSRLYENFENGNFGTYTILGDQGYPLRTWLFTPLLKSVIIKRSCIQHCTPISKIVCWKTSWNLEATIQLFESITSASTDKSSPDHHSLCRSSQFRDNQQRLRWFITNKRKYRRGQRKTFCWFCNRPTRTVLQWSSATCFLCSI